MASISGFDPSKIYSFDVASDTLVQKENEGEGNQLENVNKTIVNLGAFYTQLKAKDSEAATKIQNVYLHTMIELGNLQGALEEQMSQGDEEIQIASPTQTGGDENVDRPESPFSDRSSTSPTEQATEGPDPDQIPENNPDFKRRETMIVTKKEAGNIETTEQLYNEIDSELG